jgi:hypothetical protein
VSDPRILVNVPRDARGRVQAPDVAQAWKWVGWFALVLTTAGVGDWVLAWYPLSFGTVEWEFGTIVSSVSNLPLVTMGFAGLLGSAIARGIRWQVITVSVALLGAALLLLAALTIFALDIPVALAAVAGGTARLGILKAIAKTLFLGGLFAIAYLVAAIGGLRRRALAG